MDCHRYSLFLGDGKVHQGHLSKHLMLWGKSMHLCSNVRLFISTFKLQNSKTHTSTFCHRSFVLGDGKVHEGQVGKAHVSWRKWMLSVPTCTSSYQHSKLQNSHFNHLHGATILILQNPHFNLLHHIQLVHLLSLPAMSANLHLLFPMHAYTENVGFFGGG